MSIVLGEFIGGVQVASLSQSRAETQLGRSARTRCGSVGRKEKSDTMRRHYAEIKRPPHTPPPPSTTTFDFTACPHNKKFKSV